MSASNFKRDDYITSTLSKNSHPIMVRVNCVRTVHKVKDSQEKTHKKEVTEATAAAAATAAAVLLTRSFLAVSVFLVV